MSSNQFMQTLLLLLLLCCCCCNCNKSNICALLFVAPPTAHPDDNKTNISNNNIKSNIPTSTIASNTITSPTNIDHIVSKNININIASETTSISENIVSAGQSWCVLQHKQSETEARGISHWLYELEVSALAVLFIVLIKLRSGGKKSLQQQQQQQQQSPQILQTGFDLPPVPVRTQTAPATVAASNPNAFGCARITNSCGNNTSNNTPCCNSQAINSNEALPHKCTAPLFQVVPFSPAVHQQYPLVGRTRAPVASAATTTAASTPDDLAQIVKSAASLTVSLGEPCPLTQAWLRAPLLATHRAQHSIRSFDKDHVTARTYVRVA